MSAKRPFAPHLTLRAPRRRAFSPHRLRIAITALALSAVIGLGAGASASLASTGSVYFDTNDNAAAGETLFNGTFTGSRNVGLGRSVMPNLTTGFQQRRRRRRRAVGNTSGSNNVATGAFALSNTTGSNNVATGVEALVANTTGSTTSRPATPRWPQHDRADDNVATGTDALFSNTTGNDNVATGSRRCPQHHRLQQRRDRRQRAVRQHDRQQQRRHRHQRPAQLHRVANVAIGRNAGKNLTTGSNNIDVANAGKAGESGTIRIGTDGTQTATYIAGISGTALSGATQPVVVKSNGQLGVAPAASAKAHAAKPLSAADGRRMMAEIERLKARVQKLGG